MNCTICGAPVASGGKTHWTCGGLLADNPHHAAISAADHIVRLLTPKRTQSPTGKSGRQPAPTLLPEQLRAKLRPELFEHFDDGLQLAIAAGTILREPNGGLRLAPTPRRRPKPKDDGSEPGLFDLPSTS